MLTIAMIQARVGSTRLPGKVLSDIAGRPMLERVIERVRQATRLDETVVVTSDRPGDVEIVKLCKDLGVPCFRGDEEDVLARYVAAAQRYEPDTIVRITADCPLIDAQVIDLVISECFRTGADYASNTLKRTWPRGLDVEVFSTIALHRAACQATLPYERVHVTPYLYEHAERFRLTSVTLEKQSGTGCQEDYSRLRWTVDTPADLSLVREVYGGLENELAPWRDVLAVIENCPRLMAINENVCQKELLDG